MSDWPPPEDDPFASQFSGGRPSFAGRRRPSRHDHVGHMVFSEHRATCTECGQTWALSRAENADGSVRCRWIPEYDDW